jgi:hypothetical protein
MVHLATKKFDGRKLTLLCLLAATAALSGCGGSSESEFEQIVRQSNCVTADQVYADYQNNEVAAQQRYQGNVNRICGIVDEIELNLFNEPLISLRASLLGSVSIGGIDTTSAANISKGSVAVFECNKINELLGIPVLMECRVVPTQNMQNEATSDPEASTPNGSLPNATARQTSDFEDVNNNALIIGKRWVSSSDDADWEKFDSIFSSLSTYEQKGVPFCHLEVTAYVSYSVPCGYEEQYRYVFTGGSFGSSE